MSWNGIINDAIAARQWFHRHPELTWQEKNTAIHIREQLTELGIQWRVCAEHGTVASLAAAAAGPHIAFRSDMDALPINEKAAVDFCSSEPGVMHACGHDGHMAALLGLAAWLKRHESQLRNPISLIFQPAEEGGHGAMKMIEDGALEGVDMIFGWHNWPALPAGVALCPDGAVMSGNGTFHMTISGVGGHASQPEICADPVLAAAATTMNLQQIVSRRLPPQAAAVVSVTSIVADSNVTVTPESVSLAGSIRLSDPQLREKINALIIEISQHTAAAYGVAVDIDIQSRYEATINHADAAQHYRAAFAAELGDGYADSDLLLPIMASEDFSYYLNEIPGAFALVGMSERASSTPDYDAPCHSPVYRFNDRILESVIRVFARLAGLPVGESGQPISKPGTARPFAAK
ncbi:Hippurate hydrolase [Halioglobus japonicus]|nr:Hippurate hydrolase [Halioglobus japonicus]